jgi:hypothetical protein
LEVYTTMIEVQIGSVYTCRTRKGIPYKVRVLADHVKSTESGQVSYRWCMCEALDGPLKGRKLIARLKEQLEPT